MHAARDCIVGFDKRLYAIRKDTRLKRPFRGFLRSTDTSFSSELLSYFLPGDFHTASRHFPSSRAEVETISIIFANFSLYRVNRLRDDVSEPLSSFPRLRRCFVFLPASTFKNGKVAFEKFSREWSYCFVFSACCPRSQRAFSRPF